MWPRHCNGQQHKKQQATHLLAVLGFFVIAELDHRDPGLFVRIIGVPAVLVLVGPLVSCRADGGQIIGAEVTSAVQPALATTHTTGVLYNKGRPTLTSPQTTRQTQPCFGGNIQTDKSKSAVMHLKAQKHTICDPQQAVVWQQQGRLILAA